MNQTKTVLQFVEMLAQISASFNALAIFSERQPPIEAANTRVIPFKTTPSDYADGGVTIAVTLNVELKKPVDSDKKALGASLLLRHASGMWRAEAEIGWTGERIGWDPFDSQESTGNSVDEVIGLVPSLAVWIDKRFREEINKLQN